MSEALILASTKPPYDDRLFIELQVQYMKIPSSNLGSTCCVQKLFWMSEHVLPRFELGSFMHWICNSMDNLLSYCGLVDAKIRASDKDLPVRNITFLAFLSFPSCFQVIFLLGMAKNSFHSNKQWIQCKYLPSILKLYFWKKGHESTSLKNWNFYLKVRKSQSN